MRRELQGSRSALGRKAASRHIRAKYDEESPIYGWRARGVAQQTEACCTSERKYSLSPTILAHFPCADHRGSGKLLQDALAIRMSRSHRSEEQSELAFAGTGVNRARRVFFRRQSLPR